jgi:hypothetical protein
MAPTPVSPSGPPTLREAINAAAAGDIISLVDGTYASIRSLAKQTSVPEVEVVQASGYAVTGTSETFTIIKDTRIFQENVDGGWPGSVENLTLDYTAGGCLRRRSSAEGDDGVVPHPWCQLHRQAKGLGR